MGVRVVNSAMEAIGKVDLIGIEKVAIRAGEKLEQAISTVVKLNFERRLVWVILVIDPVDILDLQTEVLAVHSLGSDMGCPHMNVTLNQFEADRFYPNPFG